MICNLCGKEIDKENSVGLNGSYFHAKECFKKALERSATIVNSLNNLVKGIGKKP